VENASARDDAPVDEYAHPTNVFEPSTPWELIGDDDAVQPILSAPQSPIDPPAITGATGSQLDLKFEISDPPPASQMATIPQPEAIAPPAPSRMKLAAAHFLDAAKARLAVQPAAAPEYELAVDEELTSTSVSAGGGWTIPILCLGVGLIACCVIIPQAEANRFLMHEHQSLAVNLQSIEKQATVNDRFLKSIAGDPALAERLASRQMKTIRKGEKVLEIAQMPDDGDMSPFALVDVSRPPEVPDYQPIRSTIADLCNNARTRLYLMGMSFLFVAIGLVLGANKAAIASPENWTSTST